MPYNQVTECRGSEGIFVGTSRGDIQELLARPPRIIGIIDGVFAQNLSISTKEILQILEKDVTVLGASSMGALRAAELHAFGMKGIGKVFALYASGRVDADDEVALIHDEDGRQLSEPMVNIRFALQEVRVANMISLEEKRYLLRVAKMLYFPERTYRRIYTIARQHLPEARRCSIIIKGSETIRESGNAFPGHCITSFERKNMPQTFTYTAKRNACYSLNQQPVRTGSVHV
jgi:hypothetical protein